MTSNKLRLIIPPGGDVELQILEHYLEDWDFEKPENNHNNFEIHVYESLMSTVRDSVSLRQQMLSQKIFKVLEYVKTGALLSFEFQERLLSLKNQAIKLESKLKTFDNSIEKLLIDNETMALMNLTFLKKKPSLYK